MKRFFILFFSMFVSLGVFADALMVNFTDNHLNLPSTSYVKDTVTYQDSTGVTMTTYCASNGYKFNSYSGGEALIYGKKDAYLVFTVPVTVDSLTIVGVSSASAKVTWNVLVNDSVLASYTGAKETYKVVVPENLRSSGNTFTTYITNANNAQMTSITFYYTNTPTDITVSRDYVKSTKRIHNGQLQIHTDRATYTIDGNRIK